MTAPHAITPQEALQRVIEHREIFHDEMLHIMRLIMGGEMSPVLMAALISALRVKKETIGEITKRSGWRAAMPSSVISSLRNTSTSAPSSPKY